MALPLSGVRVLDLTNIIAGPLCSYQLAMMGAEVIKIEVPGTGDLSRKMGADPALGAKQMGASFLALNAGKKSLTLDLKRARGKEVFKRLARGADVVLENFRPGTMKKLGLDYPVLKALNAGVVYCAVSGFGQAGPLAQRPSYDQIIQGFCGLMSMTGDETTAPLRAGYVVCDTMAAMTAAFAVAAALYRRQATGAGEMVDVSMLDASLATMAAWTISNYLNAGKAPVPMGNESHSASPSGTFRTGNGLLNIVNNEQKQYEALCDAIGRPELKTDARFAERDTRIRNRAWLRPILEEALQAKSAVEWERLFSEAGVPAGPILTVPEILAHPQLESRGLIKRFGKVDALGRELSVTRLGFQLAGGQPDVDAPPPRLGEHTDAVLEAAGYAKDEIAALRREGVI
jgi:crotonobetainyl-CoA:carnitine CoA-transferase CaiB-like acyl-CoA transferase